jgi:hypothetical protein
MPGKPDANRISSPTGSMVPPRNHAATPPPSHQADLTQYVARSTRDVHKPLASILRHPLQSGCSGWWSAPARRYPLAINNFAKQEAAVYGGRREPLARRAAADWRGGTCPVPTSVTTAQRSGSGAAEGLAPGSGVGYRTADLRKRHTAGVAPGLDASLDLPLAGRDRRDGRRGSEVRNIEPVSRNGRTPTCKVSR